MTKEHVVRVSTEVQQQEKAKHRAHLLHEAAGNEGRSQGRGNSKPTEVQNKLPETKWGEQVLQ